MLIRNDIFDKENIVWYIYADNRVCIYLQMDMHICIWFWAVHLNLGIICKIEYLQQNTRFFIRKFFLAQYWNFLNIFTIPVSTLSRAVTTIFILGGGLEVTIGGGLTMVEAEELKNLF